MKIHPESQIAGQLSLEGLLALNEGAASAGEQIAIGVARGKGINEDLVKAIADRIVSVLTNNTDWSIINLTQLREAIVIQDICAPGTDTVSCDLNIGYNAGATKALIVRVFRLGESFTLSMALTDISNIELPVVIKGRDEKSKCSEDELIDKIDLLTRNLLGIKISQPAGEAEETAAVEDYPLLDMFLSAEKTSFSLQSGLGNGQLASHNPAGRPDFYETTILLVDQRSPLAAGSLKLGFDPIIFSDFQLSFGAGGAFAVNHNLSAPDYETAPSADMAAMFNIAESWGIFLRTAADYIKIERPNATLSMPAGGGLHAHSDIGVSWKEGEDCISAALGYGGGAFSYDEDLRDPSHDSPFFEHGAYLTLAGKWKPGEDSVLSETALVLAGELVVGARFYELPDSPFDAEGAAEVSGYGLALDFDSSVTWSGWGLYPSLQWREPLFGSLKRTISGLLGAAWSISNDWRVEGSLMAGKGTFETYDLDRYGVEVALVLQDLYAGEFVIEPGVGGTYMLLADHVRRMEEEDAPSPYNFFGGMFFLRFRLDTGEDDAKTTPPAPYFLERGIAAWGRGG